MPDRQRLERAILKLLARAAAAGALLDRGLVCVYQPGRGDPRPVRAPRSG